MTCFTLKMAKKIGLFALLATASLHLEANVWNPPYTLQTELIQGYPSPQTAEIAVNSSGQAVAAWKDFPINGDLANARIFASFFDGLTWSAPVSLVPAAGSFNRAEACINDAGIAAVTWSNTTLSQVFISIYSNGAWSASPIQVSTTSGNTGSFPKNAIDSSGNIMVAWLNGSSPNQQMMAQRVASNGTLIGVETPLSGALSAIQTTGDYNADQLSMNSLGQAMLTWVAGLAGSQTVKYAYFNGSSWTITNGTIYGTLGTYFAETISLTSTGLAAATWVDGTALTAVASLYDGTSWSVVPQVLSTSSIAMDRTQISRDSRGNAVASWDNQIGTVPVATYKIESAFYTQATNTWSPVTTLANPAYQSQLAGNPSGQALISWSAGIGNGTLAISSATGVLQATLYQNGSWSAPTSISSLAGASPGVAAVADQVYLSSSGIGGVIWRLAQGGTTNNMLVQVSLFSQTITGRQVVNKFVSQKDYVNILSWSSIWSPSTFLYYNITRDGVLIAQVAGTANPEYQDHNRQPGVQYTYTITGVTSNGPSQSYTLVL